MRKKDYEWNCGEEASTTYEQANLAVLMDIRDELKRLNSTLDCPNFQNIPRWLKQLNKRLLKKGFKL